LLRKISPVVNIFEKIPKIIMMFINGKEFLTVRNMADRLNKKPDAVKKLLQNAGLRPISRDALYPMEAFETIKNTPGPGRPKKAPEAEQKKPAKKTKK
jgi:hypothetical protein